MIGFLSDIGVIAGDVSASLYPYAILVDEACMLLTT